MKQGGLYRDNSSPSAVCTPCTDVATVVTSNSTTAAHRSAPDVTTISDDDPEFSDEGSEQDSQCEDPGSDDMEFDSRVLNSINVCEGPFVPCSDVYDGDSDWFTKVCPSNDDNDKNFGRRIR